MDIVAPEILQEQTALIQMLVWCFGIVVSCMGSVIYTLWTAKESRDVYIREQDKSNILLYTEMANVLKSVGKDVSKIEVSLELLSKSETMSNEQLKSALREVKNLLTSLVNKN